MSSQAENAGRERAGKRVFPKLLAVKQELSEHADATKKKGSTVSEASEGATCWTIFIDELAMTKRPDTAPSSLDREIFAKKLPKSITTEEELKMWLRADFGPIEHVLVLRDDLLSTPDSVAYIRFEEHEAAELFLDAQGGEGTLASWSEAERASRRTKSVYGSDVHKAFLGEEGDGLRRILQQSGAEQLWLQSEVQKPIGENVPASAMEGPYAPQLHFSITCTAEQLKKVKLALTDVLEDYHERTERLLRCYGGGMKQKTIQEFDETIGDYVDVKVPSSSVEQSSKEDAPVPAVGKNLVWDSATGKYLEEDLPEEIQDLICVTGPATAQELEKVKQMVKVKQEFGNSREESQSAPETPHNGYWQASNQYSKEWNEYSRKQYSKEWTDYSKDWGDPWHEAKRPRTDGEGGGNGFKVLFSGSRSDVQHQQWQGERWQGQWQSQEWQDWPSQQQQDWQQQQQHCKGKGSQFGKDQWQQGKGGQFGKDQLQQDTGHWHREQESMAQTSAPAQRMPGNASGLQTQGWGQQSQWQQRSEQSQWSAQPPNQSVNNQHHPAHRVEPSSHATDQQTTQQWQQQQQVQVQQQWQQEELQKVQQQEALLQQQQENERLQQERHRQQLLQQQLQQQQHEVMQQQQQENERLQQERQQQQLLQQQMQQQLQQQQMQQQMQQQQMQQQWQQQQMQQQSVFALQQQQHQQHLEWQQLEMQRLQLQNMLGYSQQMLG